MKKIIIVLIVFIFDRTTKIYLINLQENGIDIDFYINSFLNFNLNWNLTLIGTFTALLYTYICRFNAIGVGYINSGIERVSANLLEAGRLQGVSFEKSLFKIIFPRTGIKN